MGSKKYFFTLYGGTLTGPGSIEAVSEGSIKCVCHVTQGCQDVHRH